MAGYLPLYLRLILVITAGAASVPGTAEAAFPGENGRIAYVRPSIESPRGGAIYTMHYMGHGHRRLTPDSSGAGSPDWSADGARLAFWSNRDAGNVDIYTSAADGADVRRVTTDPAFDSNPSWSPDGARIAFARGTWFDDQEGAIVSVGTGGGDPQVLAQDAWAPAWSPAGDLIAFNRLTPPDPGCSPPCELTELWTMRPDGSDQRLIARSAVEPAWSPDGKHISFVRPRENPRSGAPRVWIVSPDGSNERIVLEPSEPVAEVEWAPAGPALVLSRGPDIAGAGIDGPRAPALTNGSEPDWQACVTPSSCPGTPAPGTPEDYRGSSEADFHFGGTGDDLLDGYFGRDALAGGAGADRMHGGGGDDTLAGDLCLPGDFFGEPAAGEDHLTGGDGDDLLLGCDGDDLLEGGADFDTLEGGPGNDVLLGGDGLSDAYSFRTGGDALDGGAGRDTLNGAADDDALDGGPDRDVLRAGAGDDEITSFDPPGPGFSAAEPVSCGSGTDVVRPNALDVLASDCERVGIGPGSGLVIDAQPKRTARGLRFTIPCPADARHGCVGRLTARTPRGRLVGSRAFEVGRGRSRSVTVPSRTRRDLRGSRLRITLDWRYARVRDTRVLGTYTLVLPRP